MNPRSSSAGDEDGGNARTAGTWPLVLITDTPVPFVPFDLRAPDGRPSTPQTSSGTQPLHFCVISPGLSRLFRTLTRKPR